MSVVINVNNLNKYYNGFKALKDISFKVNRGNVFGYLGSNGSGKTTTIKILLGLIKPTSGDIKVLGSNTFFDSYESIKARSKIGSILDFDGLIQELSGIDNLIFWGGSYGISKENAFSLSKNLIKLVELGDWGDVKVSKYSNGMKKRLCIARSLISDPQVLIMDEPTTGLDPESRYFMRKILKELASKGKTIFLSSHDLEEVQKICSHVGLINKGELIFNGPLDKLSSGFDNPKEFSLEKTYLHMLKECEL
ncbi:MAG: ABC transporter ATP-binding protein [Methanobrevibacter sp.]|jgi:ABC-2 type transport system ATP-binding protein|nr:ABC transporter ATP-binding protein [Candidatus Methanovirga procula]